MYVKRPPRQIKTDYGKNGRRRYRFNKRKFAAAMAMLCFVVAVIAGSVYLLTGHHTNAALPVDAQEDIQTVAGAAETGTATAVTNDTTLEGKTVVIDAGHGGSDPGAISADGTYEAEVNLKVACYLQEELEAAGAQVIMTRTDDNALDETKTKDMAERRRVIEESGSDIVVSVHMNWFDDPDVSGPLVLDLVGSVLGEQLGESIQVSL
ncbi:MAG: N-acetylmuramoyl-L-alanine amidase, partial [Eubacteriales bacterium]|nr:N-acetylmuramoyl-L-alanine amidase [Eubacteriales bacterium]